jgi:phosphoglycerate-specific signal transduction histidine kinase
MPPPAEPPDQNRPPSERPEEARGSSLELVAEMTEALTATTAYLEAAKRLESAETASGRKALREALEKGLAQVSRADGILRRLRAILRHENGIADQ